MLNFPVSPMKFDGAIFVITGGASGIGEATMRMALGNGAKGVMIWDLQEDLAQKLMAELGTDKVGFAKVNVTDESTVTAALEATVKRFGRIDCCVNCAGIGNAVPTVSRDNKPHDMASFTRVININLIGSFLTGSQCASVMSKNDPNADGERGAVVNISSVAAFDGQNGQSAYSASKMGVVGMTLPMARDLGRFGIRVNTICPGIVDTPLMGQQKPVDDRNPDDLPRVIKGLLTSQVFPQSRFGRPSEMANLVKFMFENPFLNGETIRLDAAVRMPKL